MFHKASRQRGSLEGVENGSYIFNPQKLKGFFFFFFGC